MKTIEKKIYEMPQIEVFTMQNKAGLMAGSFGADVNDRDLGENPYEIGDDD